MQNKGFVKVFAVLLTLVCVFYLSFSFVTRYHMDKAAQDPKGEAHYLDSMQNEKVYLGSYTLKQCREMEDRKSTRLNSSHSAKSRMPSSA